MLEVYWAYANFEKIANLIEELICHLAQVVCGSPQIEHRDAEDKMTRMVNLKRPWRRARYHDLVREVAGADWFDLTSEQRRERATHQFKLEILPQLAALRHALPERARPARAAKQRGQVACRCF